MIRMTDERYAELDSSGAAPTEEEAADGWHYCAEWDGLLIHPSWAEAAACACLPPDLLARYAPERASGDGA